MEMNPYHYNNHPRLSNPSVWGDDEEKRKVLTPVERPQQKELQNYEFETYRKDSVPKMFQPARKTPYESTFCNLKRIIITALVILFLLGAIALLVTMAVLWSNQQISSADYLQSCLDKPCMESKQLLCLNQICKCDDIQNTWDSVKGKCVEKSLHYRNHGEFCLTNFTKCYNNTACIDSICQCDVTTQYWTGGTCASKKAYLSNCTIRRTYPSMNNQTNCVSEAECYECSNSSNLACNSVVCGCQSGYYYDTNQLKCVPKNAYFQFCNISHPCDSTKGLICIATYSGVTNTCPVTINQCDCASGYYYSYTAKTCLRKKTYQKTCNSSCECDYTKYLYCYNNMCLCSGDYYFDGTQCVYTAPLKLSYLSACVSDAQCNSDAGLYCNGSRCTCIQSTKYYWSTILNTCLECPNGWTILSINSTYYRCYYFTSTTYTRLNAYKLCATSGATLYIANDVNEYATVSDYRSNRTNTWYWIGLDRDASGPFYWQNGVAYASYPTYGGSNVYDQFAYYLGSSADAVYNDYHYNNLFYVICEKLF